MPSLVSSLPCSSVGAPQPAVPPQHCDLFWWLGTTAASGWQPHWGSVSLLEGMYSDPWAHLYPCKWSTATRKDLLGSPGNPVTFLELNFDQKFGRLDTQLTTWSLSYSSNTTSGGLRAIVCGSPKISMSSKMRVWSHVGFRVVLMTSVVLLTCRNDTWT